MEAFVSITVLSHLSIAVMESRVIYFSQEKEVRSFWIDRNIFYAYKSIKMHKHGTEKICVVIDLTVMQFYASPLIQTLTLAEA